MPTTHPTLISAAESLPARPSAAVDSWWFAARLHAGDTVFWAKVHAMSVQDGLVSTVALLQSPAGHRSENARHRSQKQTTASLHGSTLPTDSFDVRTPHLTMSGSLESLEISAGTDTAAVRLNLRRTEPVLYSGGSGLFPLLGATTGQFALPGLATSGTVTADGVTYDVGGRTWFDRQWFTEGAGSSPRFTWLGLDLGAGRYLSVWDTAGDGTSWLTRLEADGTHTITGATRTDHAGGWVLTVPRFDASLEITHECLSRPHEGSYTGVCTVTGTLAGERITGHGYTDVIGTDAQTSPTVASA